MNKRINFLLDENSKLKDENNYLRTLLKYSTDVVAVESKQEVCNSHVRSRRLRRKRRRVRKNIKNQKDM